MCPVLAPGSFQGRLPGSLLAQMSNKPRSPIGTSIAQDHSIVVVCDDGAVFNTAASEWCELKPVPGTKRAKELERAAEQPEPSSEE